MKESGEALRPAAWERADEAIEGARGFVQLHLDVLGSGHEMEVEVRPMWDGPPCER